jgi:hypothetical protein
MNKKYILYLLFSLFVKSAFSQERVTTFGLQLKPIIPLQLFDAGKQVKIENNIEYINNPKPGLSFGMVIRQGFTKSLSLETGINFVRRNYDLTINDVDSSFKSESSFRLVNYEIPVLGLVYVQLNRNMFMNVAGGVSFDIYPTPLFTSDKHYSNAVNRNNWVQPSLLANVGWEYRTDKSGYFYFGASLHRPFSKIMKEFVTYKGRSGYRVEEATFDLTGNYLTLDLRYFFHEEVEKKKKKVKKEAPKKFIDPRK